MTGEDEEEWDGEYLQKYLAKYMERVTAQKQTTLKSNEVLLCLCSIGVILAIITIQFRKGPFKKISR